ncbi:MAG: hypothetical protein AAF624_12975 [Bacteroidota bacterium]
MASLRLAALSAAILGSIATYLISGDAPAASEAPSSVAASIAPASLVSISLVDQTLEATAPRPHGPDAPRVQAPTVPTPLWLDAPYAALALDPRAQIVRGEAPLPPLLDRASFDALTLGSWISLRRMRSDLQNAVGGSHHFRIPADARAEVQTPYRLPSLDALAEHARVASPLTTRYADGLHLSRGDTVRGNGTLLVEGDLTIEDGAALYWNGLVLMHTDREPHQLRADFLGDVQIRGALAIRQVARDTTAWQATLIQEMAAGLHVSMGNESLLYYDAQSLRSALDALLPPRGSEL